MVEDTGEMKVKHETRSVAAHLRDRGQFNGLAGSSGSDQETWFSISHIASQQKTPGHTRWGSSSLAGLLLVSEDS